MPQLPLIKGTKSSKDARYLDALPVNMVPTTAQTGSSNGYLVSFPGIKTYFQCHGASFGAHYNSLTSTEFRVLGKELYANTNKVADIVGDKLTSICHSPNSTAFVDAEKVKYFRDNQVTELKNWEEGEYFTARAYYAYTPHFDGTGYVRIPEWQSLNGFVIKIEIHLNEIPSTDFYVIGSTSGSNEGIFFRASDEKFCQIINGNTTEIIDAKEGDNSISISSGSNFSSLINTIGGTFVNGSIDKQFNSGDMSSVSLSDNLSSVKLRVYDLVNKVKPDSRDNPPPPTTDSIPNTEDEGGSTDGYIVNTGWTDYHEQPPEEVSGPSTYDLSGVIDMDRHEGRYVWISKNKLGCTALAGGIVGIDPDTSPEQRPDYLAPFYAAEADPDNNKAVKSWQGRFIAVFGRNVCQWFGLTGNASSIYASQKSMQTQFGIVSTHAVCSYKGGFAALGSGMSETLQVSIVSPGAYQKISTPTIDRVINEYKESELNNVLLDSFIKDGQDFLIVTLPNETFVYEANQGVWFQLKSGVASDFKYSGRHIIYNQEEGLTIGDSSIGRVGKLDESISSQNDLDAEMILYTPYIRVNNGKGAVALFDLEFDSLFGHVNEFQSVFISATIDGLSYGNEMRVQYNEPREYVNKVFISNIGRVNDSIGFKLRVVSKDTVNLSSFKIRVGYGN